jgi:hypothetical protein
MSSLSLGSPIPRFEYYYAAVDRVAEASEKTGKDRGEFEVHQISREEYGRLKLTGEAVSANHISGAKSTKCPTEPV